MEKEAKYLSVAGVTRIINRHSVHLLTTLQIFSVYNATGTPAINSRLQEALRARRREVSPFAQIDTQGKPSTTGVVLRSCFI